MFLLKNKMNYFIEYIFYALFFLLPWQTHYVLKENFINGGHWEYGSYLFYAIDAILIILFALSFFYQKNKIENNKSIPYIALLSLYALISFLSLYWALNQELAWYAWLRLLGIFIFLFLLAKINLNFKYLSWALVSAGFIQAVLGIVQFFTQQVVANKWFGIAYHDPSILGDQVIENSTGRWLRAYGAFPHPNILAGFLVVCLILAIYLYLQETKKTKELLIILIAFVILCGLFFTFSRTAFAGLFIGLLLIFLCIHYFQNKFQHKFLQIILILFCIFTVLVGVNSTIITGRFSLNNRLEQKSISQRVDYIDNSLSIIKQYWPTGVGIGNYTQAVRDLVNSSLENYDYQPVHNIYLLVFAETGVFSLAVIILLIILTFQKIQFYKLESIVLISIVLLFLVIGCFDHYLFTLNAGLLLFWLPIGLLNKE